MWERTRAGIVAASVLALAACGDDTGTPNASTGDTGDVTEDVPEDTDGGLADTTTDAESDGAPDADGGEDAPDTGPSACTAPEHPVQIRSGERYDPAPRE